MTEDLFILQARAETAGCGYVCNSDATDSGNYGCDDRSSGSSFSGVGRRRSAFHILGFDREYTIDGDDHVIDLGGPILGR